MKIENKLIPRRLIAGIILLLLSIFELVESYHVSAYGQMINNISYKSEGGVGLISGSIIFVVSLIFIFTSKSRPKKWVETVLGLLAAISCIIIIITDPKLYVDLILYGWANVVIACIALPWSKKGYKGMPYISKNEKNEQKLAESTTQVSPTDADEIGKYKKLLDDGAITQEEFEAKKKQLLNI